ncbi:MAG: pilus assembly protein PilM [Deltaproteobacteria bacterium]|nr:pilus assembly protein PilM [Deltaproteobacteria bacterium]
MSLEKEVSSTEKLLDVIRNKKTSDEFIGASDLSPLIKTEKFLSSKIFQNGKAISIGVDIGYRELRFVKVAETIDNQWKLLACRSVPFRTDAPKGTQEFANFLMSELAEFRGSAKKFNLWANMSSARVEVASVRIPKLPKKQIENAIYWTARKNISFDEKDFVFDFEVEGDVVESGVTKIAAMVYAAPRKEVREIEDLFAGIGYPLDGLTIVPFGIQNLFRTKWMLSSDQTVATLYIGRGWSRIDIFSKGSLVMTRGIKTGMNSMIQELMEGYNESISASVSEKSHDDLILHPDNMRDNLFMKIEEARELMSGLSSDSQIDGEIRTRFGLDEEAIKTLIKPAMDRLVRQIDRTFRYYTVTLGNEKIRSIYASTATNIYIPVIDYIGEDLGIQRDVLDPLKPENPFVDKITSGLSLSERVAFGPALGVALSATSRTPNLLFTYKDKKKELNITKSNHAIIVSLLIIMSLCVGGLFLLANMANNKKAALAQLEQKWKQTVQVDENVIPLFVNKVEQDRKYVKEYSRRYMALAAIGELSALTPSNIRLLHVTVRMDSAALSDESKRGGGRLILEGIVSGDLNSLEDYLVGYILKLQSSPMFSQTKLNKSTIESSGSGDVLRFYLIVTFA